LSSQAEQLRERTKAFALRIVRLFRSLPRAAEAQIIGKQLLRCGTSVAANYRAACRARSRAEFIAKIGVVLEEVDESVLWIEMLADAGILKKERLGQLLLGQLLNEARQLTAIFTASRQTAKGK
jgi:four helix bundle protein